MFSLGYVVDFRFMTLIKRLARYSVFGIRYSLAYIGYVSVINDIYGYLKYLFGFLPFYGRAPKRNTQFYGHLWKCAQKLKSHKLNCFYGNLTDHIYKYIYVHIISYIKTKTQFKFGKLDMILIVLSAIDMT